MSSFFISRAKIDLFNQCGYKFDQRYLKKSDGIVDFEDTEKTTFGTLVHRALERYFEDEKKNNLEDIYKEEFSAAKISSINLFEKGLFLLKDYADTVKNRKILGLEVVFETYLPNGIPVKGVIDRVDEISEDEIEITDYKTGSYSLNEEELRKDIQLGIYELVARQMYPKYKSVKLTLNYLDYGKVSIYKTDEDRKLVEDYLSVMYDRITKAIDEKQELKPQLNKFCNYCEYRNNCPAYQDIIKNTDTVNDNNEFKGMIMPGNGLVIDIEKLDKFRDTVEAKFKIFKKLKEQINEFIKDYIQKNNPKDGYTRIGGTTYNLQQRKVTKYDANDVMNIFRARNIDFNQIFDTRKTDIDNLLRNEPKLIEQLKKTAKIGFTNPYVK